VHERQRLAVVVDRVLDGLAHEAVRPFSRHGLDADRRGLGEADLLDAHLLHEEVDDLLGVGGLGLPLDARVDVFRVLAEDHHVDLLGLLDRRRDALEPAHRRRQT
jgi:hypothetical protein